MTARLACLDIVGRLLLTTDGTVTTMLEHITGERIVTARVTQQRGAADQETRTLLAASPRHEFLFRSSELVGADSDIVYLRATSVAVSGVLPAEIWAGLLRGDEPIGRLLRRGRIETFREILEYEVDSNLEAFRRYRMIIGGAPALLISETFLLDRLRGSCL